VSAASLPFEGRVDWRGLAFIEITGLAAGEDYVVTLAGGSDLTLLTYSGDSSFSTASCSDLPEIGYPAACLVTASSTSIHVAIDATRESQAFELDVRVMPVNEAPDPDSPLVFAADTLPVVVSAAPLQPSYYEISGLTAGQQYVIAADDTQDVVALSVTTSRGPMHSGDVQTGREPQVVATTTGTSLYVTLMARTFGSPVQLSVRTSSYVAQGTATAPVTATASALPLVGQVPAVSSTEGNPWERGRSFYGITDLDPKTYLLRMTGEPGIALIVFGDTIHYQTTPLCGVLIADGADEVSCSVRITGSSLYFAALNVGGDGALLSFELEDAPYESEGGPLARVEHSMVEGGIAGITSGSDTSYYRLHDVTPRQRYRFYVSEPADEELGVLVYEPGHADEPLCAFTTLDDVPECFVTTALTQLDVEVRTLLQVIDTNKIGGAFVLNADAVPEQTTGTTTSPIRFKCGDSEHHGQVGGSGSVHYEVTGLTPGATYVVELTGATAMYTLTLSSAANAWSSPCSYGTAGTTGRCKLKPSSDGKLYVRVTSSALASFDLRVTAAAQGSEGTAAEPFTIDYSALPYVGRAASSGLSHYKVTGLTRNKQYIVRVASEQEATELDIWQSEFGSLSQLSLTTQPGFPNESVWYAHATEALITVGVSADADGVTNFSLDLIPYD